MCVHTCKFMIMGTCSASNFIESKYNANENESRPPLSILFIPKTNIYTHTLSQRMLLDVIKMPAVKTNRKYRYPCILP